MRAGHGAIAVGCLSQDQMADPKHWAQLVRTAPPQCRQPTRPALLSPVWFRRSGNPCHGWCESGAAARQCRRPPDAQHWSGWQASIQTQFGHPRPRPASRPCSLHVRGYQSETGEDRKPAVRLAAGSLLGAAPADVGQRNSLRKSAATYASPGRATASYFNPTALPV